MEHPIFSLSTKPDRKTRRYEHGDTFVEIKPSADGLATVHDRDIMIYCISQVMAAMKAGQPVSQIIRFRAHDLLKATYQVDLAQRRYQEVDPNNRLVAAELESEWEAALITKKQSEESLRRFRQDRSLKLSVEERKQIGTLADDLGTLWSSESTTNQDRQDLLRILIDKIVVESIDASE